MNVAYIDIGSTAVKYRIYDRISDAVIKEGNERFPEPLLQENHKFEISVSSIDTIVFSIMNTVVEYQCHHVLISIQMHGYILLDGGLPFTNYISWQDQRGDPENPVFDGLDWYSLGTSRKSNLPVISLLSLQNMPKQPEFCTLGSYIAYRLTGKNITHITDAAASGMFCIETCRRGHSLFPQMKLPEVMSEIKVIGTFHGVEIFTPVGDHQASYAGSHAGYDAYLLNIGTATQISVLTDSPHRSAEYESRPYFHRSDRLCTITGLIGGKNIADGCDTEKLIENYKGALCKLPKRKKIILGGGGAMHHKDQLAEVCESLGIEYEFADELIVFEGLKMLDQKISRKTGVMLSEIPFENFPIILKQTNLDFFILDNEHGAFDYSVISRLVLNSRLMNIPVIIRLSDNHRMNITKFVDMGATGFLLPMTNTAADIEKVVEYAKYAPIGKRGISATRIHTLYDPPPLVEYMRQANKTVKVYAQIETRAGVERIDEILACKGLDGIFIGPNDLACDLDCIGQKEPVIDCIHTVCNSAKKAHKTCGIITTEKTYLDCAIEYGIDMISYGSELNMLINSCKQIRSEF